MRTLTVGQKLTLLIGILVAAVVALATAATHRAARDAELEAARARLASAAAQFGGLLGASVQGLVDQARRTAGNPVVIGAIRNPSAGTREAALAFLRTLHPVGENAPQVEAIAITTPAGKVVASTGLLRPGPEPLIALVREARGTGTVVGPLVASSSGAHYGVASAIDDSSGGRGYLLQWRRLFAAERVLDRFGQMAGAEARILLGNYGDSNWTNLSEAVPGPAIQPGDTGLITLRRAGETASVGVVRPVPGSGWVTMVDLPRSVVFAAANAVLLRSLSAGAVLVVLALVGVWAISRRLTGPLAELARAADAVNGSGGALAVPVRENDEIGHLAAAFNRMTARLAQQRADLDHRNTELARSAHRYQLLFDANPQPMWVYDRASFRFLAVNDAAIEKYGWSRDEFLTMDILQIRPRESAERLRAHLAEMSDANAMPTVWQHLTRDGRVLDVEIRSAELDLEGRSARLVLATDLTETRSTQRALAEAEAHLREAVAAGAAVIYKIAFTGDQANHQYTSANVTRLFGYAMDEVMQTGWWQANVHPDDVRRVWKGTLRESFIDGTHLYRFRHKDGRWRWVRDEQRLERNAGGAIVGVVGAWVDITDQRSLEEQVQQSQKMEAVGRLAGGVAHDFNNVLTVLLAEAEWLRVADPNRPAAEAESIDEIRRGIDRAAMLTRQLLEFSRRQLVEPRLWVLDDVIHDIVKLLRRAIGEDIALEVRTGAAGAYVLIDRGQLEQVLLNLAINARDAMPDGGRLRITTIRGAGAMAEIAVNDTGIGMDADVRARIFEPFFTTKEPGKGTGLGLATSYAIIAHARGEITVTSERGLGSTFVVRLPLSAGAEVPPEITGATTTPRGDETVIVVEDDPGVRGVAVRTLRKLGYDVLEAADGLMALKQIEVARDRVRLLVTDVVMPHMGGRLVAEAAVAMVPDLRVLYMSGYSDDDVLNSALAGQAISLLQKPFTADALGRKVREVLDRGSPA